MIKIFKVYSLDNSVSKKYTKCVLDIVGFLRYSIVLICSYTK